MRRYFDFLEDSVAQRIQVEQQLTKQTSDQTEVRKDMFHYLFQAKNPNTGAPAYQKDELVAEANLLVIAGLDTTSTTICALFFYITRNALVYRKLTHEIRSTFSSADEIRGGPTLSSCQYLRACIDEALRICPAVTSELQREVLPGGLTVEGDYIPQGVQIGSSAWSLHRNEAYFIDPVVYRPERWIVDDAAGVTAEDVARARSSWYPFSAGPASCVGKNLALLELMIVVARTLHRLDVRVPPGDMMGQGAPGWGWGRRNPNDFQLEDAYIALREGPMVQFRKREG